MRGYYVRRLVVDDHHMDNAKMRKQRSFHDGIYPNARGGRYPALNFWPLPRLETKRGKAEQNYSKPNGEKSTNSTNIRRGSQKISNVYLLEVHNPLLSIQAENWNHEKHQIRRFFGIPSFWQNNGPVLRIISNFFSVLFKPQEAQRSFSIWVWIPSIPRLWNLTWTA